MGGNGGFTLQLRHGCAKARQRKNWGHAQSAESVESVESMMATAKELEDLGSEAPLYW